jgi:hypothetical protein
MIKSKIAIIYLLLMAIIAGCTKDFEEINTNPNRPREVPTIYLIGTAQKSLMDDIGDEWFNGRQGMVWSQFWSQRNYTSEDRYAIRQSVNNNYWRLIYTDLMDFQEIINIAQDTARSKEIDTNYGDSKGQIAVANIMKAWAFQILTDAYGDIPYFEAFQAETNPTPAYTPQKEIYMDLLAKLKEASTTLSAITEPVFTEGDLIYNGDPVKWKKFANSLRLRVATRLSKVTDADVVSARTQAIAESIAGGVFTSNADNATLTYLGDGESNAPMYEGFYTARRNDMTVSAQFVNLLKGINDTLNNKVNPFMGKEDPRIAVWVPKSGGVYRGMPYGLEDKDASALRGSTANIYAAQNTVLLADYSAVFMDFAEVCFLLSENSNWNQAWYISGIRASMEYWGVPEASIASYISGIPAANPENVLTQKYIALYMNGYEAWAEWRRTSYPRMLVQPGEKTGPTSGGTVVTFTPIVGNAIPRRLTYPVQEYTLNRENVEAARTNMTGDELSTKVWWDK